MLEVADIIRRHGAALRAHLGDRLLPSQARALRDLVACRTAVCGGQLTQCTACGRQVYRYHSCRNRHCPKCGSDQTTRGLERHQARLLPCPHYLVTVTLPEALRTLAFRHQRIIYGALMRSAAAALQALAADPRYVGVPLGCVAVLHTWTRALLYHPHVHLIVTAGGLSADCTQWIAPKNPAFLVPVKALSILVRAKMCAAVKRAGFLGEVSPAVWTTPWVVHAQPAGNGARALDYLARYLFRVAISNSRLEQIDRGPVTFRYRDNRTQVIRRATLSGVEFLRRFVQHVLPRRCAKVRYYGLWSPTHRSDLERARQLLHPSLASLPPAVSPATPTPPSIALPPCPLCHTGTQHVGLVEAIDRQVEVLKMHLPYHESDHVLGIAYNVLCGGTCLQDIELRRQDEVYLDALGAQRIPDPTTAGDFCRRFDEPAIEALQAAINETRMRVWRAQPATFFDEAIIDADGTLAETTGACKEGMDIAYTGVWGYHPLIVSLANTQEPLYLVNRSGNRPSSEGAAERFDQARTLCREAGFQRLTFRGDTDFSQTGHLDRWDGEGVRFVFGYDARANVIAAAEALPATAWERLVRRPPSAVRTEPRQRPLNVKAAIIGEREFKNFRLEAEAVAEFPYQPTACAKTYRMVVVRKNISVEQGDHRLFDEIRSLLSKLARGFATWTG